MLGGPKLFPREFEVISFPSTGNIKNVLKGWLFKIPEKEMGGSLALSVRANVYMFFSPAVN